MSTKKKAAKKKAVKKSTTNGSTGRPSKFTGKKIAKLVKENPRRKGSAGFKSFELIKNGMTYEAYIAAGGRRTDLDWGIKHKHVKVAA
jgi:hypothetical protein